MSEQERVGAKEGGRREGVKEKKEQCTKETRRKNTRKKEGRTKEEREREREKKIQKQRSVQTDDETRPTTGDGCFAFLRCVALLLASCFLLLLWLAGERECALFNAISPCVSSVRSLSLRVYPSSLSTTTRLRTGVCCCCCCKQN